MKKQYTLTPHAPRPAPQAAGGPSRRSSFGHSALLTAPMTCRCGRLAILRPHTSSSTEPSRTPFSAALSSMPTTMAWCALLRECTGRVQATVASCLKRVGVAQKA